MTSEKTRLQSIASNSLAENALSEKPNVFPIAGLVFGLFVWVVDAVVDVYVLGESNGLLKSIFSPDESTELWMRLLVLVAFIVMGFYAKHVLIKHIQLDKMLLEYQESLELIVTERTQALVDKTEQLEILASTDSLTNLYNRRKFTFELNQELNRFLRYQHDFCVFILDIDYFKKVNDTYGHDVGDKVLVRFAKLLKDNVRRSDCVGRWGGEEFVILVIESNNEQSKILASKLLKAVRDCEFETVGKLTVSIGVSFSMEGDSHDEMIQRADSALYNAKNNGRDRVEYG